MEGLTDEDPTGNTLLLDLFSDEHIMTEDIVAHNLAADDSTEYFASMDANFQVQVHREWSCEALALLLQDLKHLQGDLEDIVALDNGVI